MSRFRLAAVIAIVSAGTAATAPRRPNVVVLLLDDVGAGDLNVSGIPHDTPALTPHIYAMSTAAGALVVPRMYIGGSVCSPTRASLLTGRTPSRECVIYVEENALPLVLNESTTAAVARAAGYTTFIGGKWHLGSLTAATSPNCAAASTMPGGTCTTGYVAEAGGLCCDGRDAHVPVATPPDFGFDVALVTPQVAPSATANCGCWATVPGAGAGCELGHYAGAGHNNASQLFLECDAYLGTPGVATTATPNLPRRAAAGAAPAPMQSVPFVTAVDDAAFITDAFEAFARAAVAGGAPFHAQLWFHQAHIPYVAPPAFRQLYAGLTENEQDYFGSLSAVDAQVGRVRALLRELGVANDTLLLLTSDNGPENSIGGHDCVAFPNPGSTGGLTGRKRSLTEGGIRVPGVIEYPALVAGPRVASADYPVSTMDVLPTLRELAGGPPDPVGFPVDGASLVPLLAGAAGNRTTAIGHLSSQPWVTAAPECAGAACRTCGDRPQHAPPPSFNASFATPFNQPQFAWTEGRLKLFACNPPKAPGSWRFSLYDVAGDRGEASDLWPALGATIGDAMFVRAAAWMASIRRSVADETRCTVGKPMHAAAFAERDRGVST